MAAFLTIHQIYWVLMVGMHAMALWSIWRGARGFARRNSVLDPSAPPMSQAWSRLINSLGQIGFGLWLLAIAWLIVWRKWVSISG